ncbi:Asp-tRNA(Asn)/Glu-tRNA(Gln) amidotransferase subunit GatB [Patescibacteria group bacterium]|nr:Asp-tRNA(Asn)/Glu-tRNA(Gln) amidotransferase subunit GatB [Patescibacteria group bacterium]
MYTPTIGLEVHAELKTLSKMFCGCKNSPHDSEPNQNICPVCMAHPGTLPVANETAIAHVLLFGKAVGGTLASYAEFDRKNYFYPDIPKAYQISQYAFPFVTGGELGGVKLTRVHLEEDTARSQHDKGEESLVDFNRAGVPLMELVTEPVIHDAKTAGNFAKELQLLLRTLGISDANMEKGEMRVEANISISADATLGTKVEVKNLNSFKSVEGAIAFEIERQKELLEKGETIAQETRGWDEVKGKTFSQRSKETAKDYRYFPDPDLPKMKIDVYEAFSDTRLAEIMPELPQEKRLKYSDIGLTSNQVEVLMQSDVLVRYFDALVDLQLSNEVLVVAANYLLTDFSQMLLGASADDAVLSPTNFGLLITMVHAKKISSRVAKDIIIAIGLQDTDPVVYANEHNLLSSFTPEQLLGLVRDIIDAHPTVVTEYKGGKVASLQFLLGQAMKQTKGAVDPVTLKTTFETELA